MNDCASLPASRILVVDDNEAIHEDFRKIFGTILELSTRSVAEIALFGAPDIAFAPIEIDSAYQGQEALLLVRRALEQQHPYAMAFIDVRMPPGWDGMETAARIWEVDPAMQIVICTAYSDYSWGEMLAKLGRSDRMVILKKPFDTIEAVQLATALTEKWRLARESRRTLADLERIIAQRTDELTQVSERLRSSEAQYRLLFDRNPHPMFVYDLETLRYLAVNRVAIEQYGYSEQQFLAMSIRDIRPQEDLAALEGAVHAPPLHGKNYGAWRHRRADGSLLDVEITADQIVFDGRPARLTLAHDVTHRAEQERKIARLSRIRAVIGGISSAMLRIHDRDQLLNEACRVAVTEGVFPLAWVSALDRASLEFKVVVAQGANPAALEAIRVALHESVPASEHPSPRVARERRPLVINDFSLDPSLKPIRAEFARHGYVSGAAFPLFVEDRVVAVLLLMTRERNFFDEEEVALLNWLSADLSFALEGIEKSARLEHLAYYDALTGLSNARLFHDRLDHFVDTARQDNGKVCVVIVDLEAFTQINDTLGRGVGDELLCQVGLRFTQVMVEPYALARIGSDTFAVASPRDPEHIATVLRERMLGALSQQFTIDGHEIRIGAQAGIALFPADGDDGKSVFKNAEAALKLAKSTGDRYSYYSSEMNARISQRRELQEHLAAAIETQQFVLHFQPRVDMISGEVVGAEALIRWQHPERGLVAPMEFIGVAEERGQVIAIGAWVIGRVCEQQAAWIAAGLSVVPIAVNVSSLQFENGELLQTVRDALAAHALAPAYLSLELTESAVMNDAEAAAATLRALSALGVSLSLDDFGTGYSSLAHLKRFPFDSVKIDRSFITDLVSNAGDAAIATAIIAMARSLNLKVVAEGVETQGQFNYLRAQDCDEMQGFLFGPAVPAEEFASQLRTSKRMTLPPKAPADQPTLLVVDDEPGISASLVRMLRPDGYRILTAASGMEGLQLLAVEAVQVIISDQRMPEMSGTDFLNTVKQLYPDTVRIILSGYTDLQVVTDAVNRGAVFKFLTKPWDDDLLREQVRDAFRRYRPERVVG